MLKLSQRTQKTQFHRGLGDQSRSRGPVSETTEELRFLSFLKQFQHLALSGLGLLSFARETK